MVICKVCLVPLRGVPAPASLLCDSPFFNFYILYFFCSVYPWDGVDGVGLMGGWLGGGRWVVYWSRGVRGVDRRVSVGLGVANLGSDGSGMFARLASVKTTGSLRAQLGGALIYTD